MTDITLYRESFTYDEWEGLCCAVGAPTTATSITIPFNEADVSFEEEEKQ